MLHDVASGTVQMGLREILVRANHPVLNKTRPGDEHYKDPPVRQFHELDVLQGNAAYGWRHYDAKIIGYLGEDLAGSRHEMLGTVVREKVPVYYLSIAR
jgi:hypothetical protein